MRIYLDIHDGAVVPFLATSGSGGGADEAANLVKHLQAHGVEVLTPDKGCYILYTKEYTEEEMHEQDGGMGFHRGYSIASLFTQFPELARLLDVTSVTAFEPFLESGTLGVLTAACGSSDSAISACEADASTSTPASCKKDPHQKWHDYWGADKLPPWDSGCPCSILADTLCTEPALVELCATSHKAQAVELGCGSGQNVVLLAEKGFAVTAVDVAGSALSRGRELATHRGLAEQICWLEQDAFKLLEEKAEMVGRFDFMFDLQCFHVLRQDDEPGIVSVMAGLLRPGGHLLVVTGNAEEPVDRGPVRLRKEELLTAFDESRFQLVWVRKGHFDPTPAYSASGSEPPLAWAALFQRRAVGKS